MNLTDLSDSQQTVLKKLYQGVLEGDEEECALLAQKTHEEGIPPLEVIDRVLTPALWEVGEAFNRMDIYLPEMVVCADAMQAAIQVLEPFFDKADQRTRGTLVLGTVKGDIHDIGKNIFKVLLEVNGFKVIDLGRDIAPVTFIDQAQDSGADMIAMSGLLSTSLSMMRDTIQILNDDGIRDKFKVIIGGGPTSQKFAEEIGADGYADTAYEGVHLCTEMLAVKA
jgi:corrinoid protein of di/trimethylamine methyltransferase